MRTLFHSRPLTWAVVTTSAVVGVLLGTAGAAQAATGTVNTAGSALTVRAAPGTSYDAWTTVADGATVTILCQTTGTSVTGTYGTSSVWDMLSNGGFVADAYVYTGSDGTVAPACDYAASPPRANPNSANTAISYEFARLGSTAEEGWCLRFQAQAYGWSYSGVSTAEIAGDNLEAAGYMHTTGVPPRGALVWYHNSAGTGHIVVSIGQGKIIGSSVTNSSSIGVASYLYRTGYRGWTVAYFPSAG
jgi:uncharacterized protein YraI